MTRSLLLAALLALAVTACGEKAAEAPAEAAPAVEAAPAAEAAAPSDACSHSSSGLDDILLCDG